MKKLTIITAIAFSTILITSCTKSSPGFTRQTSLGSTSTSSSSVNSNLNVISTWIRPGSFYLNSDRSGNIFITGIYPFTSATQPVYDKSTQVDLAYVRIPTRNGAYVYKKLSYAFGVEIQGSISHILLDHSLENDGLKLYFTTPDFNSLITAVDQTISENWDYRYLIIPRTKYQTMAIDWTDLYAVATALNFSL